MRTLNRIVEAEVGESFDIELDENLLKANREIAEENQALLAEHGVRSVDILGSVGSGKTTIIEQLVKRLEGRYQIAVINGDLTTTIDADRVRRHGVQVLQINTGKECHLDANLVKKALAQIDLKNCNLLFIENVGNLICPVDFPVGSEKRLVVISVTEGPYTVVKHPLMFAGADVAVINKVDLAGVMGVDADKLAAQIRSINPKAAVVKANSREGEGLSDVVLALNL